jgi:hypothetical protein
VNYNGITGKLPTSNPSPDGQNSWSPDFARFRVHGASRRLPKQSKQRAREIEFRQQSQYATQCPVPGCKNILLPFGLPAAHLYAVHSTKGRIAIVTDAELDAMDTRDVTDEGCRRGRSSRVVLAPRCWSQVWGHLPQAMVAKKPGTPGRARSSRKTIAQGMPERIGLT